MIPILSIMSIIQAKNASQSEDIIELYRNITSTSRRAFCGRMRATAVQRPRDLGNKNGAEDSNFVFCTIYRPIF